MSPLPPISALLSIDMPRNLFQLTCVHTLYDSGCGLVKNAYGTNGTTGAGASATTIPWSAAATVHTQGTMTFTSGGNSGVSATIKSVVVGTSLTLAYPLPASPAQGDAFTRLPGLRPPTHDVPRRSSPTSRTFVASRSLPPPTVAF